MNSKGQILLLALLMGLATYGQQCGCSTDFEFVSGYYERNLPGFHDQFPPGQEDAYAQLKSSLASEADKAQDAVSCYKVLTAYVEAFKDNHSSIRMGSAQVDESNDSAVTAFRSSSLFLGRERIVLRPEAVSSVNGLEGYYHSRDSTYSIRIVKSPTALRDYAGVIVSSRTSLWAPGQVKMELKETSPGHYQVFLYMRNHSLEYHADWELVEGRLGGTWFRDDLAQQHMFDLDAPDGLEFRQLDSETCYLRVHTFSGSWTARLDSFYKAHDAEIRASEFLILDVRNNGGGSDMNVQPLLPYFYTHPIQEDKVEIYATPDNAAMMEKWVEGMKMDKANYNEGIVKYLSQEAANMRKADPQSWLLRGKGGKTKLKRPLAAPSKVAILMNRECASSCETLLFWARESSKTLLLGENSGGYVGYGEVGSLKTPCFGFDLRCTMTRYTSQRKFEVVGIPPDVRLDHRRDWVQQAMELLKAEGSTLLFAGSYTDGKPGKGIQVMQMDPIKGTLKVTHTVKGITNPSFLTLSPDGRRLYACTHTKLPPSGTLAAFEVDSATGSLRQLNEVSSGGENPVYLTVSPDQRWLVNVNYTAGNLTVHALATDGSIGPRVQSIALPGGSRVIPDRQDHAHPHAAVFSPDGRHLLVPDLGTDSIHVFRFAPSSVEAPLQRTPFGVATAPGSGPRHIAFHPNGRFLYCTEELSGTVCAYAFSEGRLDSLQRVNAYAGRHAQYSSADVHLSPDGKYLYASNRMEENTLAVYRVDTLTGRLTLLRQVPSGGDHPRNFALAPSGMHLLVANQVTGNIAVFSRDQVSGLPQLLDGGLAMPGVSCIVMRHYRTGE